MKELSIEEKAKAYDDVVARLRYAFNSNRCTLGFMNEILHYSKESEDERIKQKIIKLIKKSNEVGGYALHKWEADEMLAWFEKQEMSYTKKDVDDAYLKGVRDTKNEIEKQYEANYQIRKDIATFIFNSEGYIKDRAKWMDYLGIKVRLIEEQDEQKDFAPKIDPKFNVGDWIIRNAEGFKHNTYLVTEVKDYYVCEELKGRRVTFTFNDVHKNFKLWDISDAKAGDVLAADPIEGYSYSFVTIYKKQNEKDFDTFDSYCLVGHDGEFYENEYGHSTEDIHPASKEQRDLLFQKMKEEGYEWDDNKKVLIKKIEEKNLTDFENAMMHIGKSFFGKNAGLDPNDTNAIKEQANTLLGLVPSKEWSEEDKEIINGITSYLCTHDSCELDGFNKWYDWLKSLKERITWNPSDEQMDALYTYIYNPQYFNSPDPQMELVESVYKDLKKLRKE